MKKILFALCGVLCLCGCAVVGSGEAVTIREELKNNIAKLEINGDWHVEINCNAAENSFELTVDKNLLNSFNQKYNFVAFSGPEAVFILQKNISPMVVPVLRINLTKSFNELELLGNSRCVVKNFNPEVPVEIECEENTVCSFPDCNIKAALIELSDRAKLSFSGKIGAAEIEIGERAVLEIAEVGKLSLEASGNSVCRINKCMYSDVEAEDNAAVYFKEVESIRQRSYDNAVIEVPVKIPEKLKK